jgi:hypothetical protein
MMNTQKLTAVLLKMLSIYVLFQFIAMLPSIISIQKMSGLVPGIGDHSNPYNAMMISLTVMALLYLALGCSLLFGADKIAKFFVKDSNEEFSISGKVSDPFTALAFQCLGIYAFITWCPNLVYMLCKTIAYNQWMVPEMPLSRRFYDNWSTLITPALGTLFGIFLILRPGGVLQLIKRSRPMSPEWMKSHPTTGSTLRAASGATVTRDVKPQKWKTGIKEWPAGWEQLPRCLSSLEPYLVELHLIPYRRLSLTVHNSTTPKTLPNTTADVPGVIPGLNATWHFGTE